ncbi:hypothetical protein M3_0168 [Lysinibacillus phage vB_LfM_LysYB1]|nr:hypothetical protein M3_0168 [Lysinibacillus phage vB_LfM_LysYB1]WAB25321.1 hypothetical protein M5_0143 [Lysinibacillus phage vB_LfM_LysYB2]
MGYTHVWYRENKIEEKVYKAIVQDFRQALKDLRWNQDMGFNINLAGSQGEGKPVIAHWKGQVRFNGVRQNDNGHESFTFDRDTEFGIDAEEAYPGRNFVRHACKTNRKPYDIAVTTFLVIAKHHLGDKIVVGSDGGFEGFEQAVEVVHSVLGYRDFYLSDDPRTAVAFNPEPPLSKPSIMDGGDWKHAETKKYSVTESVVATSEQKAEMNRILKEEGEVKGTAGGFPVGPMLFEWDGTEEGAEKLRELGVEVTDWN